MRDGIAYIAFTERGRKLSHRLSEQFGGAVSEHASLRDWTAAQFPNREALVFVGAAGIAVRAIAPYVESKALDPAVLVVDETGKFVIPLLSGHLGGANELAGRMAAFLDAEAVITTATDLNGVFAIDLWAKRQGMTVLQPERIKNVSSKLLRGKQIAISSLWEISGTPPEAVVLDENADAIVDFRPRNGMALQLIPRVLTLGIGCKRGTSKEQIEEVWNRFCEERGILPEAVKCAASIDLKQDEPGLLAFCEARDWKIRFFSAEALMQVEGDFTKSEFVQKTVGVDNVCERAAVLASGGALLERKYASDGVTLALAITPPTLDWSF